MVATAGEPALKIYLQRVLLALVIGAIGGALFHQLDMPLAWMIGAMVFTTGAALCGLKIAMPIGLRSFMVAVLGVMLGSAFTPEQQRYLEGFASGVQAARSARPGAAPAGPQGHEGPDRTHLEAQDRTTAAGGNASLIAMDDG